MNGLSEMSIKRDYNLNTQHRHPANQNRVTFNLY